MTKRFRPKSSRPRPDLAPRSTGPRLFRACLLGGFTATVVATSLIPTDVIPELGTGMGLIGCWLVLLLAWCLVGFAAGTATVRWGPATFALAGFLVWFSLSGLLMAGAGHARPTLNTVWLWVGLGAAFWLARQLLSPGAECRAMIAVMISLAVCLSMLGYHQYFFTNPATRQAYQEDPEQSLRQANLRAPPGSPERKRFEDRLNSTEPISTFTLTNSLAAFLSPWLVAAVGIAATNWSRDGRNTRLIVMGAACAVLIGGCWLLTKSRTSWVATGFGLSLLMVYGRRAGWRPDWRYLVLGGGVLGLLITLAAGIGGLDWLVLSESSKALRYRMEYWQSTSRLIQDHPWFGCGPGNFQQYYELYKLPQASESVATPHNFLFEIWSNAGTPALLAFVAVLVCFVWQVQRAWRTDCQQTDDGAAGAERLPDQVRAIYWGGLAGVVLAFPLGAMVGHPPGREIFIVGLPCSVAVLFTLHAWVMAGRLAGTVTACAISVLLVNLLGAGGIGYPGVSLTLWLMMAIALNSTEIDRRSTIVSRRMLLAASACAAVVALLFFNTFYFPALNRQQRISEGDFFLQRFELARADAAYQAAIQADPYSAQPWERLASLRYSHWMAAGGQQLWGSFIEAADQVVAHDRRSSEAQVQRGHWLLAAYRRFGNKQHLRLALQAYRQAASLYPNNNLAHARVAWTLHLAQQNREAAQEAKEALRLDGLNPHSEQKLSALQVYDPGPSTSDQPAGPVGNAEQLMLRLRKSINAGGA